MSEEVKEGEDEVYWGFRDEKNESNFKGMNLRRDELRDEIGFENERNWKVFVEINKLMREGEENIWYKEVEDEEEIGEDEVIIEDLGMMEYKEERNKKKRMNV